MLCILSTFIGRACLQYHVCYVLSDFEVDVVQVVKERKQ